MRCVFVGVKLDRGALTQISTELGRTSRVRYRCPLTRWTWLRAAELPTVHPAVAMAVFWRERERERESAAYQYHQRRTSANSCQLAG